MEILPIHSFLFNSAELKVYGTHEEPFFNCLDIVKILGCKEANDNWFYKNNKTNPIFVITLCNTQGRQSEKFFTEIGLYECLFASDSDIAKMFRREICDLLKNIRLGNVSIHINRIEEITNQLAKQKEQSERLIAEIQQRLSSATSELESVNKKLERATQKLGIYEIKIGERIYRGRSNDPENRIKQHLSNSSNPSIREAVKNGEQIETRILGTFDVITKADADHIERQYIEDIPKEIRLNRVLPHAKANEIVINNVRETSVSEPIAPNEPVILEEVKQHIVLDDLDQIIEMTERETVAGDSNVDMVVDQWFADAIQKIKEFRQMHNRYPTDSIKSNTKEEQKLGVLCVKLRLGARLGKWFKMTPERIQYIQQQLPDFAFDRDAQIRREQHEQFVQAIVERLANGLGYPKQLKQRITQEQKNERNLYERMLRIQQQYQKGELPEDELQLINERIPNFPFGNRHDLLFQQNIIALKAFGRIPTRAENEKLYLFVSKTRVKVRDNDIPADRLQMLKNECPFFA